MRAYMRSVSPLVKQKTRVLVFFAMVFALGIFLRLYTLPETIQFLDDQGYDMMIIWNMEYNHHRPLVGPFLSIPSIYTPPTYYYITWWLFHLTQTVTGIVYGYLIINIITIITVITLAWNIYGKRAASIAALLLSVSSIMIEHARLFWQPYPTQLFLSLWLLCMWHAHAKKNVVLLWISATCFIIALSIYPSPVILIPLLGYQLFSWYNRVHEYPYLRAFFAALYTAGIPFLVVYMPQIVFEITHAFPTWNHLPVSFTTAPIHDSFQRIGAHAYAIVVPFLTTNPAPSTVEIIMVFSFFILLLLLLGKSSPAIQRLTLLFEPRFILIGALLLILYPIDIHAHRSWIFLPYLFLLSSAILSKALQEKTTRRILAGLSILIYIVINGMSLTKYLSTSPHSIETTRGIARAIEEDIRIRGLSEDDTGFFYKKPNDMYNGSYGIYRYAYWLLPSGLFPSGLTYEGNTTRFDYSFPVLKPYMYVICDRFSSSAVAYVGCVLPTIGQTPYHTLREITAGKTIVFVLERERDTLRE